MYRFWKSLTLPILKALKPEIIVEVGSYRGDNTKLLWDFCKKHSIMLHIIDPAPSFSKEDICGANETKGVFLHKKLSLDALPAIQNIDVALIDGDHNWYTVYHELKTLIERAKIDKTPFPLVLFHDVAWPYARRDLYYNPETIPEEFRHEYAQKGILPGCTSLLNPGFNSSNNNALHEGGPRNGVLTAIEDFLDETNEAMHFYTIPAFNGYGILVAETHFTFCPGLRKQLAGLLPSEHVRLLIADLEKDRLEIKSNLLKRGRAIAEKDQAIAEKDQAIAKKDQAIAHYREELYTVYTSRSWRYTTPLRKIGTLIRRVLRLPHKPRIRAVIKRAYFMLPAFIRNSRLFENLKNRFKSKENIIL